jgi:hypothetical protein
MRERPSANEVKTREHRRRVDFGFTERGDDDGVDDPNEFPERPERKGLKRW